jgi:NAD(P)-dependent dehydrogenase (short-subunit alcohol dehydrogenase family)
VEALGVAAARKFAREGARLMLADIRLGAADAIAAEGLASGAEVEPIEINLARAGQPEALIDRTMEELCRSRKS